MVAVQRVKSRIGILKRGGKVYTKIIPDLLRHIFHCDFDIALVKLCLIHGNAVAYQSYFGYRHIVDQ